MRQLNMDEEETFNRLSVFKAEIASQRLGAYHCPLLESQLNDLAVLARKMQAAIRALQETFK